ncbi:MAG: hypothetical protein D6729_00615 [Deltaproteobacteria bacterium]|nr:MAG: hypothetical protein D6729_00615 [Deltaproteobacteria bacterium]
MQLTDALTTLIKVEEHMAVYYHWAASCFSNDPDAKACFEDLAAQERGHANQLGLLSRMARSGKIEADVPVERSDLEALVRKVETFRRQNRRPLLPHVVLFALRLESGDLEHAYQSLVTSSVPELARLARAMIRADEAHAEKLKDLMEKKRAAS